VLIGAGRSFYVVEAGSRWLHAVIGVCSWLSEVTYGCMWL